MLKKLVPFVLAACQVVSAYSTEIEKKPDFQPNFYSSRITDEDLERNLRENLDKTGKYHLSRCSTNKVGVIIIKDYEDVEKVFEAREDLFDIVTRYSNAIGLEHALLDFRDAKSLTGEFRSRYLDDPSALDEFPEEELILVKASKRGIKIFGLESALYYHDYTTLKKFLSLSKEEMLEKREVIKKISFTSMLPELTKELIDNKEWLNDFVTRCNSHLKGFSLMRAICAAISINAHLQKNPGIVAVFYSSSNVDSLARALDEYGTGSIIISDKREEHN
ncbi:hypothetical protein J4217_02535 [Candidatus Pacearchaeota archaeon]|nr:hypothetical protein [Candidatus Pacearchaeota archaeon]